MGRIEVVFRFALKDVSATWLLCCLMDLNETVRIRFDTMDVHSARAYVLGTADERDCGRIQDAVKGSVVEVIDWYGVEEEEEDGC